MGRGFRSGWRSLGGERGEFVVCVRYMARLKEVSRGWEQKEALYAGSRRAMVLNFACVALAVSGPHFSPAVWGQDTVALFGQDVDVAVFFQVDNLDV